MISEISARNSASFFNMCLRVQMIGPAAAVRPSRRMTQPRAGCWAGVPADPRWVAPGAAAGPPASPVPAPATAHARCLSLVSLQKLFHSVHALCMAS